MSDLLPMADGSWIYAPADTGTLGQPSVGDAVAQMQRAGGFSGPVTAGVLLEWVGDWTEGGRYPPHWLVWAGGEYAFGFTQLGVSPVAGFNDYAVGHWVVLLRTGVVGTLLGRLVDTATFVGSP